MAFVFVMICSKTYCGYCTRVKNLLSQLGAAYKVHELDQESEFTLTDSKKEYLDEIH